MRRLAAHRAVIAMSSVSLAFVLGGFAWALAALGGASGGTGASSAAAGPFILHFNGISGITQIGTIGDLAAAGVFAAAVVVINFVVALELDARDRVLGKVMAAVTLAAAVLLFIGCAAIINVNV